LRKLADSLSKHAVLLRIPEGSQEATYLAAFVQIKQAPSLAFIGTGSRQGQITVFAKESDDLDVDDIAQRLISTLELVQPPNEASTMPIANTVDESPLAEPLETIEGPSEPLPIPQNVTPVVPSSASPSPTPSEQPKRKKGTTESESWAETQRKRNHQARQDRDRILAQIHADRQERKSREAFRKQTQQSNVSVDDAPRTPLSTVRSSQQLSNASHASIQIRLVNGELIRSSFASSAPASELQTWIEDHFRSTGTTLPAYRLKHLPGPPLPARTIDIVDESSKSLLELDLAPSATLVLLPISGSVNAYSHNEGGFVGFIMSILIWILGVLVAPLKWIGLAGGSPASEKQKQETEALGNRTGSSSSTGTDQEAKAGKLKAKGVKVRTITEMNADAEQEARQLYNGNQLNFEDEEDDK
jgi:hypothetical protein